MRPSRASIGAAPLLPQDGSIRLLLLCQPLDGGVPQHVLDLIGSLPAEYRFDVVCPRSSILWTTLQRDGRVRLHPLGPGRRPGVGDLISLPRLLRLARRADVIHAHSAKAGFLGRLAAVLVGRRARTVFTPHCWSFWAADGFERRVYSAIERRAARWCQVIVAVSEDERDAGIRARIGRPEQYAVIRNGIDLDRFSAEPEPIRGRILFVGRLAAQKRPELALAALAELERLAPGVAELRFAGDGPLESDLRELARRLGLERSVVFLGGATEVSEQLAHAACCLLTSAYEGCPISVLEAMAANVPVVAVEIGGLREIVEDGVTGTIAPGEPRALATALLSIIENPSRAASLGAAGRRAARARFARSRPAGELDAVYRRLARSAPSEAGLAR